MQIFLKISYVTTTLISFPKNFEISSTIVIFSNLGEIASWIFSPSCLIWIWFFYSQEQHSHLRLRSAWMIASVMLPAISGFNFLEVSFQLIINTCYWKFERWRFRYRETNCLVQFMSAFLKSSWVLQLYCSSSIFLCSSLSFCSSVFSGPPPPIKSISSSFCYTIGYTYFYGCASSLFYLLWFLLVTTF